MVNVLTSTFCSSVVQSGTWERDAFFQRCSCKEKPRSKQAFLLINQNSGCIFPLFLCFQMHVVPGKTRDTAVGDAVALILRLCFPGSYGWEKSLGFFCFLCFGYVKSRQFDRFSSSWFVEVAQKCNRRNEPESETPWRLRRRKVTTLSLCVCSSFGAEESVRIELLKTSEPLNRDIDSACVSTVCSGAPSLHSSDSPLHVLDIFSRLLCKITRCVDLLSPWPLLGSLHPEVPPTGEEATFSFPFKLQNTICCAHNCVSSFSGCS